MTLRYRLYTCLPQPQSQPHPQPSVTTTPLRALQRVPHLLAIICDATVEEFWQRLAFQRMHLVEVEPVAVTAARDRPVNTVGDAHYY